MIKVQGVRGELINNELYFLDENYVGRKEIIVTDINKVMTGNGNPNLAQVNEIKKIGGGDFMGVIFHPCSSLCGSQQTLDHAGDQCVQCFIDGILYLALFKWYPQREFLGNPVFHRIYMYHI